MTGVQTCALPISDEVAYAAHDIDDGVRSGLLAFDQLLELPLIARHRDSAVAEHPSLAGAPLRRLFSETLRRMLSAQIRDLVSATRSALIEQAPVDVVEVRASPWLVAFSPSMRAESTDLKRLLFALLYRHPQVERTTARAREVLHALFEAYRAAPRELPDEHRRAFDREGLRALADYIAGMTDRFASREYLRLIGVPAFDRD